MEGFISLLLLFLVIGLLDKIMKAAAKARQQQSTQAPPEVEWRREEGELVEGVAPDIRELIMEELGLSLERRPRVRGLPEAALSAPEERAALHPEAAPGGDVASVAGPRTLTHPGQRRVEGEREGAGAHGAAVAGKQQAEIARRRDELRRRRSRAAAEVGGRRAVSLERPRRAEDHELFHERYDVPTPVSSHTEFHDRYMREESRPERCRRGPRVRLPQRRGWSAVRRAIVWAEVLGPPRGLIE